MGRRDRRNEKRKKALMSFFLIAIMVVSIAGIFIGNYAGGGQVSGVDLNYGDFKFDVVGGLYTTNVDGKERKFNFHPVDTLSVQIPNEARSVLHSPVIVVTFDPDSSDIASAEVAKFQMEVNIDKIVYTAVTKESEIYEYPVVTCANATPQFPVVYFEITNKTSENTYNNGCIVISGNGLDIVKSSERIIYELLGVIDE